MSTASRDSSAPQIDFAQFIVSLGQSALVHLGETADPTGATAPDPTLARHSIDLLHLLRDKTKGNLDEDEQKLLDTLLAELDEKLGAVQK